MGFSPPPPPASYAARFQVDREHLYVGSLFSFLHLPTGSALVIFYIDFNLLMVVNCIGGHFSRIASCLRVRFQLHSYDVH